MKIGIGCRTIRELVLSAQRHHLPYTKKELLTLHCVNSSSVSSVYSVLFFFVLNSMVILHIDA